MKLVMKTLILMKYGGGTWVQDSAGMVTVSKDSTQTEFNALGKTGGEKEHTHNFKILTCTSNNLACRVRAVKYTEQTTPVSYTTVGTSQPLNSNDGARGQSWNYGDGVFEVSEGITNSNSSLQPYIVTVRWHRTA